MDYVSLHKLQANWDNAIHKGTSYSSPLFAGMVALVQGFFKDNTGKKLNHEQLNRFIRDNCIDLEEKGHDPKTGYGLFVLPDPETIDIEKYTEVNNTVIIKKSENQIILQIGNKTAIVNGETKILDAAPMIKDGRTMVPIRFVVEELGCKVEWEESSRKIIIER